MLWQDDRSTNERFSFSDPSFEDYASRSIRYRARKRARNLREKSLSQQEINQHWQQSPDHQQSSDAEEPSGDTISDINVVESGDEDYVDTEVVHDFDSVDLPSHDEEDVNPEFLEAELLGYGVESELSEDDEQETDQSNTPVVVTDCDMPLYEGSELTLAKSNVMDKCVFIDVEESIGYIFISCLPNATEFE